MKCIFGSEIIYRYIFIWQIISKSLLLANHLKVITLAHLGKSFGKLASHLA